MYVLISVFMHWCVCVRLGIFLNFLWSTNRGAFRILMCSYSCVCVLSFRAFSSGEWRAPSPWPDLQRRPESSQRSPKPFNYAAPGRSTTEPLAIHEHISLDPAAHHPIQLLLNLVKGDFFWDQFPLNFFSFKVLVYYLPRVARIQLGLSFCFHMSLVAIFLKRFMYTGTSMYWTY